MKMKSMTKLCTLRYKDARHFFRRVRDLCDEVLIRFDDSGMWTKIVDPAHVEMRVLTIPESRFVKKHYRKTYEINMELEDIEKLFKKKGTNQNTIDIYYKNDKEIYLGTRSLLVRYECNEYISSNIKVPDITLPVRMELNVSDLKDLASVMSYSDSVPVQFTTTEDMEVVIIYGYETQYAYFRTGHISDIQIHSMYSSTYIMNIINSLESEKVIIEFGEDYPLRVISSEPFEIIYLLAPRIGR